MMARLPGTHVPLTLTTKFMIQARRATSGFSQFGTGMKPRGLAAIDTGRVDEPKRGPRGAHRGVLRSDTTPEHAISEQSGRGRGR